MAFFNVLAGICGLAFIHGLAVVHGLATIHGLAVIRGLDTIAVLYCACKSQCLGSAAWFRCSLFPSPGWPGRGLSDPTTQQFGLAMDRPPPPTVVGR
jgi:hypothetical protein